MIRKMKKNLFNYKNLITIKTIIKKMYRYNNNKHLLKKYQFRKLQIQYKLKKIRKLKIIRITKFRKHSRK